MGKPTDEEIANTVTTNDKMVVANGEDIVILLLNCRMDREKALRLAAWIVAIADPAREDFERIFAAVCST